MLGNLLFWPVFPNRRGEGQDPRLSQAEDHRGALRAGGRLGGQVWAGPALREEA